MRRPSKREQVRIAASKGARGASWKKPEAAKGIELTLGLESLFPVYPSPNQLLEIVYPVLDSDERMIKEALRNLTWPEVEPSVWQALHNRCIFGLINSEAIVYFLPSMLEAISQRDDMGAVAAGLDNLFDVNGYSERSRILWDMLSPSQREAFCKVVRNRLPTYEIDLRHLARHCG